MSKLPYVGAVGAILLADAPLLCAADSSQVSIVGADTSTMKVLVRKIDEGEILWVGQYKLGTRASTTAGSHKINVMCQFIDPAFTEYWPGNVTIEAQAGEVYNLTGAPSKDGKSCDVQAAKGS